MFGSPFKMSDEMHCPASGLLVLSPVSPCAPPPPNLHFEKYHVPPNTLNNSNFGAIGGGMARATWAYQELRRSPWVLEYLYFNQMITQSNPEGSRRNFFFCCNPRIEKSATQVAVFAVTRVKVKKA